LAKKVLYDFRGQFPATALFQGDAPACKEVPEGMQGVFRLSGFIHDTSPDHYWGQGSQDLLMVRYSAQRAG
jgi:hypothetical protein